MRDKTIINGKRAKVKDTQERREEVVGEEYKQTKRFVFLRRI